MAERIWIDTDAACGAAPRPDPDDRFAIALLVRRRGGDIAGISTVSGNADMGPFGRNIAARWRQDRNSVTGF